MEIDKLLRQRKALVDKMRALLTEAEKRDDPNLTAEERTQYDRMDADVKKLEERVALLRKQVTLDESLKGTEDEQIERDQDPGSKPEDNANLATKEYREAFRGYLRDGIRRPILEERALQVDSDTAGGYLAAPQDFIAKLIKGMDNLVFMRRLATVVQIGKAASLGAPALDNDPADPDWTGEITTRGEDSTMSVGKRELSPHPLAKMIKISKTLIRRSVLDAETLVRDRLQYKFAVTEENAFQNGNGARQPLGVFTASAHGISTSQDVSTGNTDSEVKGDGLYEAKFKLKGQYWGKAVWIFNRAVLKQIAKLKDGEGRYLWQPSIAAGHPDSLLQLPVYMSEYAPSTMTTGLYVGIVGDFSNYWIVDALDFTVQALMELYAVTNQNAYIGNLECDGMPVLAEAFARVTLA